MSNKDYVSVSKLGIFLQKLFDKIDIKLSPNSTNPISNKAVYEEFEAVGESFAAMEVTFDNALAQKSQVQIITWEEND